MLWEGDIMATISRTEGLVIGLEAALEAQEAHPTLRSDVGCGGKPSDRKLTSRTFSFQNLHHTLLQIPNHTQEPASHILTHPPTPLTTSSPHPPTS